MDTPAWECGTDEQFRKAVQRLNTLFVDLMRFQLTNARKDHVDLFGETIKAGEDYYKRDCGGAFGNVVKVSEKAMDRLCAALFLDNRYLQDIADAILANENQRLHDILKAMPGPLQPPPDRKDSPPAQ